MDPIISTNQNFSLKTHREPRLGGELTKKARKQNKPHEMSPLKRDPIAACSLLRLKNGLLDLVGRPNNNQAAVGAWNCALDKDNMGFGVDVDHI